ncbi:hypothetical protein NCM_03351 [Burkholderia pseudomallei]
MQAALRIRMQDPQLRAATARGHLPRHEVRVMLERADDDLVAFLQHGLRVAGNR